MLEQALALDLPTVAAGTYEGEPFPPANVTLDDLEKHLLREEQ